MGYSEASVAIHTDQSFAAGLKDTAKKVPELTVVFVQAACLNCKSSAANFQAFSRCFRESSWFH